MCTTRFGDSVTHEINVKMSFILYEANISTAFLYLWIATMLTNSIDDMQKYGYLWRFYGNGRHKKYIRVLYLILIVSCSEQVQNDCANEIGFMGERDVAIFQFKMSLVGILCCSSHLDEIDGLVK